MLALVLSNSSLGAAFVAWWETQFGFLWDTRAFAHSLLHWVNHGLLTIFFFCLTIILVVRVWSAPVQFRLYFGPVPTHAASVASFQLLTIHLADSDPVLRFYF